MGKNLLTPNQHSLLELATQSRQLTRTFYLTGGTALSHFYFQHRFSEDLDFFSEQEYLPSLPLSWSRQSAKQLKASIRQQKLTGQEVFYFNFPKDTVKVDFAYYPFPHLGTFTRLGNLRVSSIEDIATNKVGAILTRKRARDYLDLYLCMQHLDWETTDLQKAYRLKFDINLSDEEFATNFVNILDASDQPIFLGNYSMEMVKSFFLNQAKKLSSKIVQK